jgi:hypothetical protein
MKDSLIRTVVPIVVGFAITQAARLGVELDEATVASFVTMVVSSVYYAAARWLEQHASPQWGLLLGSRKQPSYTPVPIRVLDPD